MRYNAVSIRTAGWMAALLMLGVPLSGRAQAKNPAEELFKKMEEKLARAKKLTFTMKTEGKEQNVGLNFDFTSTVTLDQGNKGSGSMKGTIGNIPIEADMIMDGAKVKTTAILSGQKVEHEQDIPDNLTRTIVQNMLRAPGYGQISAGVAGANDLDQSKYFRLSDFKMGKKERINDKMAQKIEYTVSYKEGTQGFEVTIWIDTNSHIPLKRVLVQKGSDPPVTVTETFSDIKINGKDPQGDFGPIK